MSKTKNPFDNIDFSHVEPVPWTPAHSKNSRGFQCIQPVFRTLLSDEIPTYVKSRVSKAWVIIAKQKVVAYAAIRTDVLRVVDDAGRPKKIVLEDAAYTNVPSIKIQLLAADKRAKGAGKRLMKWLLDYIAEEIAPRVGVRFVTVDAYYSESSAGESPYDSSLFYRNKFGFSYVKPEEPLPPREGYRSMYLDLLPLIEGLEGKRGKKK
jgi:hypothetical protein